MKGWLLFPVLLLLIGCGSSSSPETPPRILYGQDACDRCRMIINDPAFATAYRLPDGTARRFDDIGCMMLYLREHGEQPVGIWVHDYDAHAWLDARTAYYVHTSRVVTPMAYGLLAVSSRERAVQLADSLEGKVLTFKELQQLDIQPVVSGL